MKKNTFKRMMGFLLSGTMLLSAVPAAAEEGIMPLGTVYHENQKLQKENSNRIPFLKFNGAVDYDNFVPMQVSWTNPANNNVYQAYCINPAYPGYGDVADYGIDIEKFDNDCIVDAGGSGGSGKTAGSQSSAGNTIAAFLEGAVNYGFPTVSAETLLGGSAADYGISQDELDYAAYLATKMAIWSGIHTSYGIGSWSVNNDLTGYPNTLKNNVLNATKSIYNKAGSYTPSAEVSTVTFTAGTPAKEGSNYEVTLSIGNTKNNVEGTDMMIEMGAGGIFTDGITISSMDGDELEKTTTSGGDERYIVPEGTAEVKAVFPDPGEGGLSSELRLYAQQNKKMLLYGRSTKYAAQSYVLAGNHYDNPTATFQVGDVPAIPDTTPEKPSGDGDLTVIKLDARDNATPLAGVTFDCYNSNGQLIDTGTTDNSGKWIPEIDGAGTYTIVERSTNNKYQLTEPTTLVITVEDGKKATATFRDYPSQTVTMEKEDAVTGEPVPGCQYEIMEIDGKGAWRATGKTDNNGKITWEDVPDGTYLVREVSTVEGYILDATPQYVTVRNGQAPSLKFLDSKYPGLTITKVDQQTGEVITAPATFRVEQVDGSYSVDVTTENGVATLKNIPVGTYKITEKSAPEGYVVAACPDTVAIGKDESKQHIMYNVKKPVLTIEKTDKKTGEPISGTKFEVKKSDGTKIGTVETGKDGKVTLGMKGSELGYLDPDTYTVTEVSVPAPYILSKEHQDIKLAAGDTKSLLFENTKLPTLIVQKTDATTNKGIPNTTYKIEYEQTDGGIKNLGTFKTDKDGYIRLPYVEPGWYIITETLPAQGYQKPTNPVTRIYLAAGDNSYTANNVADSNGAVGVIGSTSSNVEITSGSQYEMVGGIVNYPLNSIVIKKADANTGEMLDGATFEVIKTTGETSGQNGTVICTVTTDHSGVIVITGLEAGAYAIREIKAPANYLIAETDLQTVNLKADGTSVVEVIFRNLPYGSLLLSKVDEETNQPLAGARFKVTTSDGTVVGNGNGEFVTDNNGEVTVPNLKPSSYIITELNAPDGYVRDDTPKTVKIGTDGGTYRLEFTNKALSGIKIIKTDSATNAPLTGVSFSIAKLNGENIGTYQTDKDGMVYVGGLVDGWYTVTETKGLDGYHWDKSPRTVEVKSGKQTVVEVENTPMASILIHKVDSETGEGIYGVTFLLYDKNNNPIGQFVTDDEGYIHIDDELEAGKYKLREIEPADGYLPDNKVRSITVQKGRTTEIEWENTPQMGQIQITKKSSDDNPYNGFPAGTVLRGAEFEIYDRNNRLMDTIVSDKNGIATSKKLPLGRYIIRETKAPDFYGANTQDIHAEIEYVSQIVRMEVYNSSLYTNVAVNKKGYTQVAPNQPIRYEFTGIKNNSTVSLNSFYWRDTLPVEAVRLDKIITGTWNQRLSYKIVYKTNLYDYRTLADNLDTAKNNVILASPAALGLYSNEYITDVMFVFGTVKAGFAQVETPYIYCNVLPNVSHEQRFTNSTDVGGLHQGQWIMSNDRWVTVVYGKQEVQKLPRTGY